MPDDDQLTSQVRRWMQTRGYPLEMRVANALRSNGFAVGQAATLVIRKQEKRANSILSRYDIGRRRIFNGN